MAKSLYTRETILKASIQLARKYGFKRLTMRMIAKKIGSSVIPIYENFINKEDLLDSIYVSIINQLKEMNPTSYYKRNEQLLLFGFHNPLLYQDI